MKLLYSIRSPYARKAVHWIQRWTAAIERSLTAISSASLPREFDLSGIATACALDYLTFRCPEIGWAQREPALFDWLQPHLARRSMQTTAPQLS
jgi:glutathione S-transferase